MELGRSCVDPNYRSRSVMQLLWRGIGAYINLHDIELMFGCGSFSGIDTEAHALSLAYLHHYHLAPENLRLKALPDYYASMNTMEKDIINPKEAFNALPPLLKGYLRLGGYVGEGAAVDKEYNTIDVGVVVKTALVGEKYMQRYTES